jgi:hypothetical protein
LASNPDESISRAGSPKGDKQTALRGLLLGVIILLSLAGGVIASYSTTNGPWGYTDPVEYISTANSILHGRGIGYYEGDGKFTLTTIHPPFYSVVLSIIGISGINLVEAARWLNILAFVASIFIAGWIFYRYSSVPTLGVIASALMGAFPHMLVTFSSAYSEPLFILLILISGWCLLISLKTNKLVALLVSAVILGLVPFTRYAGAAILASGIAIVFFFTTGNIRTRLIKTFLFALIGCLPLLLWLLRVYVISDHSVGGRALGLDWGTLADQFQGFRGIFMDTVWKWIPFQKNNSLLPYRVRFLIFAVGLVVIIAMTILAARRLQKHASSKQDMPIFTYFGLSVLFYLVVLVATFLFTKPTIDINDRTLLPFFVCLVMGLLGAFSNWQAAWFAKHRHLPKTIPWLTLAICLYWYIPQTQGMAKFYHGSDGLTAYHWDRSETIQAVRSLPVSLPVISNDWELLLLWTERPIQGFWHLYAPAPTITTDYWRENKDLIKTMVCNQRAALVIFDDFYTQFRNQVGDADAIQVEALFSDLTIYGKYADGMIFQCP